MALMILVLDGQIWINIFDLIMAIYVGFIRPNGLDDTWAFLM